MYRGILITAGISLLAVAAFAAEPATCLGGPAAPGKARGGGGGHGNTDGVLVDNLCTAVTQISKSLYGAAAYYDSWLAFDYTPDKGVKVNKLWFHYVYNTTATKSTLNFRLYQGTDPGTGSIVRSWDVSTSNYNEVSTGWYYGTPARLVYRAEVTIPDQDLTAKIKYWFAYRSATTSTSNALYWCVRKDSVKEEEVWWYLYGAWKTAQGHDPTLGRVEQSYKIESVTPGIAPTSFGKIKTLFH